MEWEYKTVQIGESVYEDWINRNDVYSTSFPDPDPMLNQIGKEGWELVGVYTEVATSYPNFGSEEYHTGIKTNTRTRRVNFVFKRLKQESNTMDVAEAKIACDSETVAVEVAEETAVVAIDCTGY